MLESGDFPGHFDVLSGLSLSLSFLFCLIAF